MPIQAQPPWYSTPTAIAPLPTTVPISCNSLIDSSLDTPATVNCKNKSYDNIEIDCPDDDNNNKDVDCFPRQDKQPVLPKDISTDTLPSLIECPMDKSTNPMNTNTNNNDSSDDDDDDDDDNSTVIQDNQYYDNTNYDDDDDAYALDNNSLNYYTTGSDGYD